MKDLYLLCEGEPCFMCAMALVHSRISRVYCYLGQTDSLDSHCNLHSDSVVDGGGTF